MFFLSKCCKVFLLALCLFSVQSFAQMVGTEFFLKSNFIQVGVHTCGAIGTSRFPPPDYYGKGVVVDVDTNGWTVGSPPYMGDYIEQGSPVESWSVFANGQMGRATKDSLYSPALGGGNISAQNYPNFSMGLWSGRMGNLQIQQRYYLLSGSKVLYFQVLLSNTGSTEISDVYYHRNVDPDNEAALHGDGFVTLQSIRSQPNDSNNHARVAAHGLMYQSVFEIFSDDPRAKVYYNSYGLFNTKQLDSLYHGWGIDSSFYHTQVGDSLTADVGMGIVFNVGSIPAGEKRVLNFRYSFDEKETQKPLNKITKIFAKGLPYNVGDTIVHCRQKVLDVEVVAAFAKKIQWLDTLKVDDPSSASNGIYPDTTHTYRVVVEDDFGNRDTLKFTVQPIGLAQAKITKMGSVLSVPPIYKHYQWRDEFLPIVESNMPSYKVEYPGKFLVTTTDSLGCTYDSDIMLVSEEEASINHQKMLAAGIAVYPNPAQSVITFEGLENGSEVRLFNIMGQQVYSFAAQNNKEQVSINHLASGMYLLQIRNVAGEVYTAKIVKE